MALLETINQLFIRDLTKLKLEIESYQDETIIWKIENNIANSSGNLTLHLIGNLNHFIGTILGNTEYIRQRDLEFSTKNIPRSELISQIESTLTMIKSTLKSLNENDLERDYPIVVFESKMSTSFFLIHLTTHLAYHLGQINYHRRFLD